MARGMTSPPLYEKNGAPPETLQIVGPVCETTDALARDVVMPLPPVGRIPSDPHCRRLWHGDGEQLQRATTARGGGDTP